VRVVPKEDFVVVTMVELIDLPDERVEMESIGGGMTVERDPDLVVDLEEDVLQSRIACTGCTYRIVETKSTAALWQF